MWNGGTIDGNGGCLPCDTSDDYHCNDMHSVGRNVLECVDDGMLACGGGGVGVANGGWYDCCVL